MLCSVNDSNDQGLLSGDRIPDFERVDQHDKLLRLYQDCCGRSAVLAVIPDEESLSRRVLSDLRYANGLPGQPTMIALVPESTDAAALAKSLSIDYPVLRDNGEVSEYITGSNLRIPAVFALDANLRLLARLKPDPGWVANLRQNLAGAQPAATRDIASSAPVLFIPRAFPQDLCTDLIAFFDQGGSTVSGVLVNNAEGGEIQPDPTTKIRREKIMAPSDLLERVESLIARRVLPEIARAYQFRVTRYEGFKVVRYESADGGYFATHRDNDGLDTAHRRFALTINLNTERYRGGELRFPEYGADRYQPPTGGAVVFSCHLAHGVMPVTAGNRYALVSFFYTDADHLKPL